MEVGGSSAAGPGDVGGNIKDDAVKDLKQPTEAVLIKWGNAMAENPGSGPASGPGSNTGEGKK